MQTTVRSPQRALNRWLIVLFTVVVAALSLVLAHTYESSHSAESTIAVASMVSSDLGAVSSSALSAEDTRGGPGPLGDLLGMCCVLAILVGIVLAVTRIPGVRLSSPDERPLGFTAVPSRISRAGSGPSLVALAVSRT